MIQFSNATGRTSDLNKLMVKELNNALESGQTEFYTQAMFKLNALLISSKGNENQIEFCILDVNAMCGKHRSYLHINSVCINLKQNCVCSYFS